MTKTIIFDSNINNDEDFAQSFIDKIEGDKETNFRIYLMSLGGNPFIGVILSEVLNHIDNINRIELIACSYVESSAFELFYKFLGKRSIILGTSGMFHHAQFGGVKIIGAYENKSNHDLKCTLQKAKTLSIETERIAKEFCTKKELSLIKNGGDCHFSFERMVEIFKDAKIING